MKEEILSGMLMEDYVQAVRIADIRTVDSAKGEWGEEPEMDLTKRNELNLVIRQEIWNTMEERFILFEDIEKVIVYSKKTGQRFFNPEDSSYLANLRIDNVTYWVRYKEKEDGIYIISVYSHRMEVVKE